MGDHVVYRMFNADGELLYVGMTSNLGARFKSHSATKDWWPDVARTTLDHYQTREAAHEAEQRAIKAEHPRHNVLRYTYGRLRSFRVPDEMWHSALAVAAKRGTTATDVVIRYLEDYVKDEPRNAQ